VMQRAHKSLMKRYLFWLFKTTRDELDKIDRKFTQLEVDRSMQKVFLKKKGGALTPFIDEWGRYMAGKEADAKKLKFDDAGGVLASYSFLRLKLKAIESVADRRFGPRLMRQFEKIYEDAAMKNILQDISGKR
jgi:hypothetical protein